ncbi:MAG: SusC/RagA family TonB-linked outer membrane protein [Saprospiraceae bacterium]
MGYLNTFKSSSWRKAMLLVLLAWGWVGFADAQVKVRGKVTDKSGSEPLIGVNILEKNTGNGTITDLDGNYEVTVSGADAVLVFSYTGYASIEETVGNRGVIDITLDESAQMLEQVVVVGYGTQRKQDLTGAVSTVKGDDLAKLPTASVQQALQGKMAGVQVVTASGRPGDGAVVRIRGVGTLNDARPLYVVDGLIVDDINFLNSNDIENINVLKDASATAIYGARGANGVVLVSTKRGKIGQAARISFSTYQGFQEVAKTIELTNATEYAILANEIIQNEVGGAPTFPDPASLGEGTDWQNEIYQVAPMQNYNVAFSGATEKMSYSISGDYFDQEGILEGSRYRRLTVRANNEYHVKSALKIGHNIAFINTKETTVPDVTGNTYRADPTVVGFVDGVYGNTSIRSSVGNPLAQLFYENDNLRNGVRLLGNVYADLTFLKHFTFRSSFGINVYREDFESFSPTFMVSAQQQRLVNGLTISRAESTNWLWENTVTFQKEWGDNLNLTVLGGVTSQNDDSEFLGASVQGLQYENEALRFINFSELDSRSVFNGASSWSILSYLFRVNTTLFQKYLLTASFRADGSSRFGENNRYGYFPSFSLGWRITEEAFMENQNLFSTLKLRAGWGQTGNDRIGNYESAAVIATGLWGVFGTGENLQTGALPLTLSNPDLQWESTTQSNIGLEMGFFKNKLTAEIDYYNRTTEDILWRVPIPLYIGLEAPPLINAAQVSNKGIDLALSWRDNVGGFGYRASLVGSSIDNEVLRLSNGEEQFFAGGLGLGGQLGTITRAGLPVGSFYGYEVIGIFQNEGDLSSFAKEGPEKLGDLIFKDQNADGIITDKDRIVLGNSIPDYTFGFSVGADWMGFDLSVDFTGQAGNEIINSKKMARFNTPNFERGFLDRWTGEGTSNTEPRVTNSGHNYQFSSRFVEDGSFLALRNLQLSYSLPQSVLQKIRLTTLRVFVAGTNLKMWTKYTGYTPEIVNESGFESGIDRAVYPISKVYTFGLNASF